MQEETRLGMRIARRIELEFFMINDLVLNAW
jgi:hypothetical protein